MPDTAIIAPVETVPSTSTPPVEPAVDTAPPVAPVADSGTVTPDVDTPSEPTSAAEKRIKQLTAKHRDAEREAAYWKGLAEGRGASTTPVVETPPTPQADIPPIAPHIENFETYEEYEVAKEQYLVQKAKYEVKQELKHELETTVQQQTQTQLNQKFQERIKEAAKEDPEILEIIKDPTLPISKPMSLVIRESEVAPEVLKFLSENREIASKISTLSEIAAAKEIGYIEAIIKNKPKVEPPRTISQAPTPIETVTPVGSPVVDESQLSTEEWIARRNRAQFSR